MKKKEEIIKEFINLQWHPVTQIPDEVTHGDTGRKIICDYELSGDDKQYYGIAYLDNFTCTSDWKDLIVDSNGTHWAYLDSFLPQTNKE